MYTSAREALVSKIKKINKLIKGVGFIVVDPLKGFHSLAIISLKF